MTASQLKPGGWGQHFQVEECQGFIQRSQSSDSDGAGAGSRTEGVGRRSGAVEQIARKDDESIFTLPPRQCSQIQHWQKFTSCELESPRWWRREKSSARQDPSVNSPDMPGASEQSVALFQHQARDRSAVATLIDHRTVTALWFEDFPMISVSIQRREIRWCKVWVVRGVRRRGVASRSPRLRTLLGNEVPITGDGSHP